MAWKNYSKLIVAAIAAGVVAVQAAITDNTITGTEWWTIAFAVLGALGVYVIPNKPGPTP